MTRNRVLLVLFIFLTMAAASVSSAFAQDVDLSNLSREQIQLMIELLQQMLQDNGQGGTDPMEETPADPEAITPVTGSEPVTDTEAVSIYGNKKLLIEALPGYMFIRPSSPAEAEPEVNEPSGNKQPEHYENEPGIDDIDGGPCSWSFWNGQWVCMKG